MTTSPRAAKRLASSKPKPEAAPVMSTRRGPRGSGERPKRPAPDAAARPAAPTIPAMAAVRAGKRDVAEGDVAQEAFMPRTLVGAAGPGGEIAPPVRWSTP